MFELHYSVDLNKLNDDDDDDDDDDDFTTCLTISRFFANWALGLYFIYCTTAV